MKKHRNLLDLYYENTAKVDYESAFIYSTNFSLSYKETEMLTNAIAHDFAKKIHVSDGIAIVVSNDSFVKAICAMSLVKINLPFVFLQATDSKKFKAINKEFQIAGIICDNSFESFFESTEKELIICQITREPFKDYLTFGNCKSLRRMLPRTTRENLPFRVQFTSGTTGEPKMNILQQFDIADVITTCRTQFVEKLGVKNFAQYLSLDYAFGIDSLFGAIYNGVPIYLFEENEKKDLNFVFNRIEKNNIDVVFLPSSLVNVIARTSALVRNFPKSLKVVVAGGESVQLTAMFVKKIKDNNISFVVGYGCSEMQLFSLNTVNCDINNDMLTTTALMGIPCENCELVALDENCQPLTHIGQAGTLFVKRNGKGVNGLHPLRASNPTFSKLSNSDFILYETSDIVTIDKCGYMFCGRNERRVKVHGYWVDLDYITHRLLGIEGVVSAYVTTFLDEYNNSSLACLYTGSLEKERIVQYLKTVVQPHEIPTLFIMVEAIPLTITDKTDTSKCKEIINEHISSNARFCLNNDQINLTGYDIADTIKAIFSKYCEEICVMADSEFNDVGIDSLVFLVILCEIEESLNIRLNMEIMNFNEINTLNKLIEAILNQI